MSENNQYEILWKAIGENLEQTLAHITYTTYIAGLRPVDIDGTRIVLETDTEFFAKTIVHQLKDKIKAAIAKADTGITDFALKVSGSDEFYYRPEEEEPDDDYTPVAVDPRFTFESFVAGKSNEFVFAAAQSVAKNRARTSIPYTFTARRGWEKRTFCNPSQIISTCINLPCACCIRRAKNSSTNSSIPFTSTRARTAATCRQSSATVTET